MWCPIHSKQRCQLWSTTNQTFKICWLSGPVIALFKVNTQSSLDLKINFRPIITIVTEFTKCHHHQGTDDIAGTGCCHIQHTLQRINISRCFRYYYQKHRPSREKLKLDSGRVPWNMTSKQKKIILTDQTNRIPASGGGHEIMLIIFSAVKHDTVVSFCVCSLYYFTVPKTATGINKTQLVMYPQNCRFLASVTWQPETLRYFIAFRSVRLSVRQLV